MKKEQADYLWDKTGADTEIERLENVLRAFGHQANNDAAAAPPVDKILLFKRKPARRALSFAVAAALAACILFAVITSGIRFETSNDGAETAEGAANNKAPTNKIEEAANIFEKNGSPDSIQTTGAPNNSVVPFESNDKKAESRSRVKSDDSAIRENRALRNFTGLKKITKTRETIFARNSGAELAEKEKTSARRREIKPQTVRLTEEERYAYSRLMFALSITNSKLQLVKDKMQSVRDRTAGFKGDGR